MGSPARTQNIQFPYATTLTPARFALHLLFSLEKKEAAIANEEFT